MFTETVAFLKSEDGDSTCRRYLFYLIAVLIVLGHSALVPLGRAQHDETGDDFMGGFDDMAPDAHKTVPDDFPDDLIDGFEDLEDGDKRQEKKDGGDAPPHAPVAAKRSAVHLGGHAKAGASYNFARKPPGRGLHHLKTELLVEGDLKPIENWQMHAGFKGSYDSVYVLNGGEKYTQQMIDAYESELEFKEVYLQGGITPNLDLKLGRQIVIWGKSDNIRIVDTINPMDLREPGITDIEDLRLPVTMTKLDYYRGPFNLSGMLIHEVRFAEIAPYGSEFYPLTFSPPPEEIPASSWENTQYAVSLNGIFSGWDLSVYWANLYSATPHLELTKSDSTFFIEQKHARYDILGSAANIALGNWLIKGEAAWLNGLKFTNSPDRRYKRLDLLMGLEYSGITNTQLALEIADQHILDYDDNLGKEPDKHDRDQLQWAARLTSNFMNETLALTLLISVYGEMWQDGAFQRLSAEYDLTDTLMVNGGIVFYQSGDLIMFKNMEYNDRLFLEFKYAF